MKSFPEKLTTPPMVEIAPGIRGGFPYRQPETGAPFAYNTWHELILNVYNHRKGMGLDLAHDWHIRFEHDFCVQNPHLNCLDDEKPVSADTPLAIAGRALWKELHEFTEQYPDSPNEDDKTKARFFLAHWRERIPRFGGCACREDWARLESNYPADLSSKSAFHRWGVVSHDAVNRKIGHPIFHQQWWDEAVAGGLNVFP